MNNVFIISARRSGTHLLSDLITNNFNISRIDGSIDFDFLDTNNVNKFISELNDSNKLAWSHSHNFDNFFDKDLELHDINRLKEIFSASKIIYVYRDIRDVITSHYYRPYNQERYDSFIEYYNTHDMRDFVGLTNYDETYDDIVTTLINQHKNWFSVYFAKEILGLDMCVISYEEIIANYLDTVKKISTFLGKECDEIKDVRLKSIGDKKSDIEYTAHHFRRGGIGDWREVMDEQWGLAIDERYRKQIRNHVNAYLYNSEANQYNIDSKNWDEIDAAITKELIPYQRAMKNIDIDMLINNRYNLCDRKLDDVRYSHKIFYFDEFVVKYIIPCKADLDNVTFKKVIPIASKISLLNIHKTYNILINLGIVPKLYYAGLVDGILLIVQEKIDPNKLIYRKYVTKPNWDWMVNNNIFPKILDMFNKGIVNKILLSDIISPYNLAMINGELKCVDMDGIHKFNSVDELKSSSKYKNMLRIFTEIDTFWMKKYGYSELEKINF